MSKYVLYMSVYCMYCGGVFVCLFGVFGVYLVLHLSIRRQRRMCIGDRCCVVLCCVVLCCVVLCCVVLCCVVLCCVVLGCFCCCCVVLCVVCVCYAAEMPLQANSD